MIRSLTKFAVAAAAAATLAGPVRAAETGVTAAPTTALTLEEAKAHMEKQQENMKIVETALDNARAGNLDVARQYFADDFLLVVAEGVPTGGTYHGWDGYVKQLKILKDFWEYTKQENREFLPIGDDRVMIRFDVNGKIRKNGQIVKMPVVAFWTIKNGKITYVTNFYFDTKKLSEQAAMP
jgi:ketosteroid isomerase-like protein